MVLLLVVAIVRVVGSMRVVMTVRIVVPMCSMATMVRGREGISKGVPAKVGEYTVLDVAA